jgi:hypothetical protein
MYCAVSPTKRVIVGVKLYVVDVISFWTTTAHDRVASWLEIVINFTWRCVDEAGAARMAVVVALEVFTSLVEGANVVVVISLYETEISIAAAVLVVICNDSVVALSMIILFSYTPQKLIMYHYVHP